MTTFTDCYCVICDGRLHFIGTLASERHYRCRNCGFDQTQKDVEAYWAAHPAHHEEA